jgi:hypothetical protein
MWNIMSKNNNWMKWVMCCVPVYFLVSAGKEIYFCQFFAETQGLSLNGIFQSWFSDQLKFYGVLHVKALLHMQSAFYMVLFSFVFSIWIFTGEHFKNKSSKENTSNKNA